MTGQHPQHDDDNGEGDVNERGSPMGAVVLLGLGLVAVVFLTYKVLTVM